MYPVILALTGLLFAYKFLKMTFVRFAQPVTPWLSPATRNRGISLQSRKSREK